MNFELSEDQIAIRDAVRDLCEREFAPHAAHWDAEGLVPPEAVARLAEQGFLGMVIPESAGGLGYDYRTVTMVVEEIARISASLAIMIAVHNSVGAMPVWRFGSDEQKRRFMPRLVTRQLAAFCLSEPSAGSDASAIESYAVRDGDHYVLHGAKNWVTNGERAGLYLIFAKTDRAAGSRGISAFLVERDTPGLVLGKPENKMGLRGSDTIALTLEDLRVPASQRLGAWVHSRATSSRPGSRGGTPAATISGRTASSYMSSVSSPCRGRSVTTPSVSSPPGRSGKIRAVGPAGSSGSRVHTVRSCRLPS